MLAEQVDGLLITPVQTGKKTIEELKKSGLPFALLGRHFDDLEADYVVTDDIQGGFLATEHLIKLGHKKIAMVNGPLHISSAKERFRGYKKALDRYRIKLDESLVSVGAITTEDGYKVTESLLNQRPRPTAIFAYSDFVAFGVLRAIREARLSIPEDVAVIGYDDVEFSSCLEIPLTTVRIPKKELGRKAASLLLDKIRGKVTGKQALLIAVELIYRESTKPAIGFAKGGDSAEHRYQQWNTKLQNSKEEVQE